MLTSKLQVPRVLGTAVHRDQLLRGMKINELRGCTVTVVSAPAGAGKTMLLAQRTGQLRSAGKPVAWLSLDSDDNNPRTLWSGILAASRRAVRDLEGRSKRTLSALRPPVDAVDDGFISAYVEALDSLTDGLWLVLDDVHEIVDQPALSGLSRLLTHAPPNLRLMLGCRHDPPLPIARMVVEETAVEIRAADLAFDRNETRELLLGHAVEITDRDLELLLIKTEGWAAGLRLAALSLAPGADVTGYVDALAGDNRVVAAYLVSEVLVHQPTEIVAFLLATAIPEVLTAELATGLSGRDDAGAILDRLARENVLVFRRDSSPRTYRYHTLLRSYLLAEHDHRDAEARRNVHRRASDWFARHGDLPLALDHAAEARDRGRVTDLVVRHGLQLVMEGRGAVLPKALDAVGDDVLAEPAVALVAAMSALLDGDAWRAAPHLDLVGRDVRIHRHEWHRLLHATVLLYEGRLDGALPPDAAELVELTRASTVDDPDLELLAVVARGVTMIELGDLTAADTDLTGAFELARRNHRDYVALDCLGYLTISAAAMSDFAAMVARANVAIEFATERGWSSSSPMLRIYVTAGWAAWQAMDVAAAARYAASASAIDTDAEAGVRLALQLLKAYVGYAETADRMRLRDRLRKIWHGPDADAWTAKEVTSFSLLELRTALSSAQHSWADEVVARADDFLDGSADVDVLKTMVHAYHGRNAAARRTLRPVITGERTCAGINGEISAWLLEAHLAAVSGEPAAAHDAVAHAIALAAPRGALRIVVATASRRVGALLRAGNGRYAAHEEFLTRVLAAMDAGGAEHGALLSGEALTAREVELLRDLPSLLTLGEIAAAHVVSVNTVKSHLRAIYRKLNVTGRRAAVERAFELGLI